MKGPKVVVAGIIQDSGKILLGKEVLEDGNEWWIIPGGGVEFGETLEQAVRREMKEELGLDVEPKGLITFKEHMNLKYDYHTIIMYFLLEASGTIKLEEKVKDAGFFTIEETKAMKLVDSARWFVENHLEKRISTTSPSFST